MVSSGVSEWSAKKVLRARIDATYTDHNVALYQLERVEGGEWQFRPNLPHESSKQQQQQWIVKPDMLLKRRGKLGLVKKAQSLDEAQALVRKLSEEEFKVGKTKGYLTRWIVEPLVEHTAEYYICILSSRDEDTILFCHDGGVDIGCVEEKAARHSIPIKSEPVKLCTDDVKHLLNKVSEGLKEQMSNFIIELYNAYRDLHMEYLEINPFTFVNGKFCILDCAMKVDNCAEYLCKNLWKFDSGEHSLQFIPSFGSQSSEAERYIENLDARTGASLKFSLINPRGKIWTLVAGGGASVVYADTICDLGYAGELANYGEYSGAPSTLEVYQYTRTIFNLMFGEQSAKQGKVLLIGGSIANFTNIAGTFEGIASAITDFQNEFKRHKVKILVRRGGPNYKKGLQLMSDLGHNLGLNIKVFGPDAHMTSIISMALGLKSEEDLLSSKKSINNKHSSTSGGQSTDCNKRTKINENGEFKVQPDAAQPYTIPESLSQNFMRSIESSGSVHCNFTPTTTCFIIGLSSRAIQTMLDFDYECERLQSVEAIVDPFQSEHLEQFFWGSKIIRIPVYKTMSKLITNHPNVSVAVNFASLRSCYNFTRDILLNYSSRIKTIAIIAEGVPDNLTRHMVALAKEHDVTIIGPATVGGIKPRCFKVANTGGGVDQFTEMKLYKQGSVGIATKSGGLSNEMMNIVSRCTDGVFQCIAIGGDRYPCTKFIDVIMEYENSPECALILLIGEIGGTYELEVAHAIKSGIIKKPVIAWCIGTCNDMFSTDVSFGHAGAYAAAEFETAIAKNKILHAAGAYVPDSFEHIPEVLSKVYEDLVLSHRLVPKPDHQPKHVPIDYSTAKKLGLVRYTPHFTTSITDERGSEVTYNNVAIKDILSSDNSIGATIGHLWMKKKLPLWAKKFIEICIPILADHGPGVSGSHNTIVASRAGKDLVSSLVSGLLTIGPLFGGAMDCAARDFYQAHRESMAPAAFVEMKKQRGERVSGIGHRVKSIYNPDSRVTLIVEYVKENFPKHEVLDFAMRTSEILLEKKQNLILNVDGAIGSALVDMMICCGELFKPGEIEQLINDGAINGFFILSRTIGLIGHHLDQKRLKQGLYRHSWDDINKVD